MVTSRSARSWSTTRPHPFRGPQPRQGWRSHQAPGVRDRALGRGAVDTGRAGTKRSSDSDRVFARALIRDGTGVGRARDLVAGLPAGFRRRVPVPTRRPAPHEHRLRRIVDWFDHAIELGASGIALGPIFASRTHGYDTDRPLPHRSATRRRRRLRARWSARRTGAVCGCCSTACSTTSPTGLRSRHSWFRKRGNGFDTFEGHGELIALDHDNPEVVDYIVDVMTHWLGPRRRRMATGRRLRRARHGSGRRCSPASVRQSPDAWFVGEVIHGDYSGAGAGQRLRLGDAVRAVEGDLERPQRRQLPRARLGARAAQRVSRHVRADDVRRQPRCHPNRQPAGRHPATWNTRWSS